MRWTVRRATEANSLISRGIYVIAVNGANRSGTTTFMIDGRNIGNVKLILEERHLEYNEGHFTDHFDHYDVHIYKLD